jgi:hypothetical protein
MFATTRSDHVRSRVTLDEIDGLQITIPAAQSLFLILFLSVWLIGWLFGELSLLGTLTAPVLDGAGGPRFINAGGPQVAFLIPWLICWTVGGAVAMDALIWQFRGRETVGIDPDGRCMVIRRLGTLIPRRARTYSMDEVSNLRFAPLSMGMFPSPFAFRENLDLQSQWMGMGAGNIAFDHAGGTRRFGTQLSEAESRRLIRTIKDHYKIPDDKDEPLPVERL